MIDGILLMFTPASGWERIKRAQHSVWFVLFTFVLPVMLLSSAVEAYGLIHWGKWQGQVVHLRKFSLPEAVVCESLQFVISFGLLILNSMTLRSTSSTFVTRHTFKQAFTTMGYGLGAFFLLRMLNAAQDIPSWLTWVLGIFVCLAFLYHGVPQIMQPDPAHAFGLYVTTILLLTFTTGLFELCKAAYLSGSFPRLEQFISSTAARLPL